jgi:hypothetical protein
VAILEKTQVLEFVSKQAPDAIRVEDGLPCICSDKEPPAPLVSARHKRKRVGGVGRDVVKRQATKEDGYEYHNDEGGVVARLQSMSF